MTPGDADAPPLIVVGASVRAMAESARRAGWSVHAADLFADADLRAIATVAIRVPTAPDLPWPAGLETSVRRLPLAPWLYGGALENHPELVDRLALARPLAGNDGDRLRRVRDPALLARAVRAAGLFFPDTVTDPTSLPTDGSFLVKPRAGAGGRGVARWRGGPSSRDCLWQRFVPGPAWSAAFAIGPAGARLFGASRQLVGQAWCGARGFTWCGAVDVPVERLGPAARGALDRLGSVLAADFGLVGLVGADLVSDRAGRVHVIEVNPRPTASLELVERATGASVAATHMAASGFTAPSRSAAPARRAASWAKAVVFADRTCVLGSARAAALEALAAPWSASDGGWSALADVPPAGTTVDAGRPVLTVCAAGRDSPGAVRALRGRVAAVRAVLADPTVSPPGAAAARRSPPAQGSSA